MPLLVEPSLLKDLKAYVAKESISGGLEQVFTTGNGKKLSSTVSVDKSCLNKFIP